MAKARPSRLTPLTLRFLTGLAHAHTKKAGAWPAKNMIGFYERLTGAVFFPDRSNPLLAMWAQTPRTLAAK